MPQNFLFCTVEYTQNFANKQKKTRKERGASGISFPLKFASIACQPIFDRYVKKHISSVGNSRSTYTGSNMQDESTTQLKLQLQLR